MIRDPDFDFWKREKFAADGHDVYYEPEDENPVLTLEDIERSKNECDPELQAIRDNIWKPEWDYMEESEKLKYPEYTTMLYEMWKYVYEKQKGLADKYKGTPAEKATNEIIDSIKKCLEYFEGSK